MTVVVPEKINGVSFVAANGQIDNEDVDHVVKINANYAAIMPYGFIRSLDNPEIIYNTDRQWFGETSEGVRQYVETLRASNIKIMLKPHIWVWRGEFTGNIKMSSEEDWHKLETSYSKFILEYAALAEELNVPIFCIGTELEQFVANRITFWLALIEDVKEIYKGELTYAANWDEFKRTPFWGELDHIGIDAYFPVSDSQMPSVEECRLGWQIHKPIIEEISEQFRRPVLFTEFGYRSVDFTGKEPWRSDRDMDQVNMQAQVNATTALFDEFWDEKWFSGGFVWKWFHFDDRVGGPDNSQFTPQNKPVEAVIKDRYLVN